MKREIRTATYMAARAALPRRVCIYPVTKILWIPWCCIGPITLWGGVYYRSTREHVSLSLPPSLSRSYRQRSKAFWFVFTTFCFEILTKSCFFDWQWRVVIISFKGFLNFLSTNETGVDGTWNPISISPKEQNYLKKKRYKVARWERISSAVLTRLNERKAGADDGWWTSGYFQKWTHSKPKQQ